MKFIFKQRLVIVLLVLLSTLIIFNIKVYATDESFTLEQQNIDVVLNQTKQITYTGETDDVIWKSSDESIATVENGMVTGHKIGTAIITATVAGAANSYEVTVYNEPVFTDFSNAKYELSFEGADTKLKITGVTLEEKNQYYYIITDTNTKPSLSFTSNGGLNQTIVTEAKQFIKNKEENYLGSEITKYVELNQDLYLWVIEEAEVDMSSKSTKFVAEGIKLTRTDLYLNEVLKGCTIMINGEYESTTLVLRFPSVVDNRKFKIKIGKVTDNTILQKIQKNDYSGITSLRTYAINDNAIYTNNLETTSRASYNSYEKLLNDISVLENKGYYYIYIKFDDENGKYYPVEGLTLAQVNTNNDDYCNFYSYTDENFEWSDLSSTPIETEPENKQEPDNTIATGNLPHTGSKTVVMISLIIIVIATMCVIFYKKYNWLKDIK